MNDFLQKYNVPGPCYISYPTVPYWDATPPTPERWGEMVNDTFAAANGRHGISLYVHIPFCESLCTYCGCNTRITINHKVERPYLEAVVKEWELYKKVLGNETKGHILTEEDLILRRHIQRLMCNFETTWHNENEKCKSLYEAINRLEEMEADGLVEIKPFHLRVTSEGRNFVRNVCMAFDARLWEKVPETQVFSLTV